MVDCKGTRYVLALVGALLAVGGLLNLWWRRLSFLPAAELLLADVERVLGRTDAAMPEPAPSEPLRPIL